MKLTKYNLLIICILSMLSLGCASSNQSTLKVVDADELKELMKQNVRVIDVRTPEEYAAGRIGGSTLINFRDANFADEVSKIEKDEPVVVYCAVGGRSSRAAELLKELGFETVYNYKGGFSDWENRKEVIEKD